MRDLEMIKRVLIAFIPTAIIGITAYKFIKQYLIGSTEVVLLSLLLGGIVLIAVEILMRGREGVVRVEGIPTARTRAKSSEHWREGEPATGPRALTYERAFVIGLFQSVSMAPGVSRAAATIIGGLIVGLPRKTAVEFSFLLAIPTMLAATALDLKEINFLSLKSYELTSLTVGFITSFFVALVSIKWLLKYVQKHNFIAFGVYRIVLSIIYFLLIFG